MSHKIMDGKALAEKVKAQLAHKIVESKICPSLRVILVGDNEASKIYVRNKLKAAASVGIDCEPVPLSSSATEEELLKEIEKLNQDKTVDGFIVQLPLPNHISQLKVLAAIDPKKDVDGFSPYNAGLLDAGSKEAIVAATPKGILRLLKEYQVDLCGKNVLVIGRSNIVGKPLAMLLLNENATVTVAHSKTTGLQDITRNADIVIVACGVAKLVKKDWLKEGAVVVDVGINHVDGKLCGDVDFEEACSKVSLITPVPGGVGPMTVAMLLENTLEVALRERGKN